MTVSVGDELLDGMLVVVSVDEDDGVVSVLVPADKSWTGAPLHITFTPAQTVRGIEGLLAGNPP